MSGFLQQAWQSVAGGPAGTAAAPADTNDDGPIATAQVEAPAVTSAEGQPAAQAAADGAAPEASGDGAETVQPNGEADDDGAADAIQGDSAEPGADANGADVAEPAALEVPEIPRLLAPEQARSLSLVGRYIDVLWPDDGTWWKARVTSINPTRGDATLYYEPNAKVVEEPEECKADGEAKPEPEAPGAPTENGETQTKSEPMELDANGDANGDVNGDVKPLHANGDAPVANGDAPHANGDAPAADADAPAANSDAPRREWQRRCD